MPFLGLSRGVKFEKFSVMLDPTMVGPTMSPKEASSLPTTRHMPLSRLAIATNRLTVPLSPKIPLATAYLKSEEYHSKLYSLGRMFSVPF